MKKIKQIIAVGAVLSLLWIHPVPASYGEEERLPPAELLVGCITGLYEPREEEWKTSGRVVKEEFHDFRQEDGGRSAEAVRTVIYEKVEFPGEIPGEIGVQTRDEARGLEGIGRLTLSKAEPVLKEDGEPVSVWAEDFSMILTFRAYGAETYELAGKRIPHQEGPPPLKGYETELLGLIGAAEEDHRITGFEWAGERYLDDYGIAYRNARAFGLRKLTDYQVSYVGRVYFRTSETAADSLYSTQPSGLGEESLAPSEEQEELPDVPLPDLADIQELGKEAAEDTLQDTGRVSAETEGVLQDSQEPPPAFHPSETAFVKRAAAAARAFTEQAKQAEEWIYQKTSILISWQTLLGGGLTAAALLAGWWRKRKYFL